MLIVLLLGCNEQQKKNEKPCFSSIPVDYSDNHVFNLSSLSEDATLVKLETNDSCLIQDVRKIFCIDDQIVIGIENDILFFDKSGNFKYLINRQGAGPEEYLRLSDFDISHDRKRIFILDTGQKEILEYDFEGTFKRRCNLDNWYIGIQYLNDSLCLLYSGNQLSSKNSMKFTTYNIKTSSIVDSFYPISEKKSKYLHVHSANNFTHSMNELLFCELYNDTIYMLSSSGYAPLYYIDFGKHKIPSSFWDNSYNNIMEFQDMISKHTISYGVNSLASTPNGFFASCYVFNRRCFLYVDKRTYQAISFRQLTDERIFGNYVIDALKYKVRFYSDRNFLLTVADNELYIDGRKYIEDSFF
jgi:hypothetical protein